MQRRSLEDRRKRALELRDRDPEERRARIESLLRSKIESGMTTTGLFSMTRGDFVVVERSGAGQELKFTWHERAINYATEVPRADPKRTLTQ